MAGCRDGARRAGCERIQRAIRRGAGHGKEARVRDGRGAPGAPAGRAGRALRVHQYRERGGRLLQRAADRAGSAADPAPRGVAGAVGRGRLREGLAQARLRQRAPRRGNAAGLGPAPERVLRRHADGRHRGDARRRDLRRPRRAGRERGLLADGHRGGHHEAALGSVGRGRDPDRHAPRVQGRDDVPDGSRLRGVCQLRAGSHQRGGPDPGRGRPAHGPGAGRERDPRDLGRAAQCREALAGLRAGHRGGGRGGRDPDAGRAPRAAGGHRHLRLRQLPRAPPELCGRRRDPLRGRL